MSNKTKQKKTEYTLEFKQDAAKLVNEKGYTHQQAADSLGISLSAIGRWAGAERGFPITPTTKKAVINLSDQTELLRLRKENTQKCGCKRAVADGARPINTHKGH